MNFQVVSTVHPDYVGISTNAEYTLENLCSFLKQIKAASDECKGSRVLIDCGNFPTVNRGENCWSRQAKKKR